LGGRCGGWDSRDHDVFMRVWTQVGLPTVVSANSEGVAAQSKFAPSRESVDQFIRKLTPLMPGKDGEEIDDHVRWNITMINLVAEKKAVLNEWKIDKGSVGEDAAESNLGDLEEGSTGTNSNSLKPLQDAAKEMERVAMKERVMKWKLEKEESKRLQAVRISI
jgi:hypothetical protein